MTRHRCCWHPKLCLGDTKLQFIGVPHNTLHYALKTRQLFELLPHHDSPLVRFTDHPVAQLGKEHVHCLTHIIHNSFAPIYGHDYGMRTAINNEIVRGKLAGHR